MADDFVMQPLDPTNRESVVDVLGYLSYGRMGDDLEEDPFYIKFMKKAFCHFAGVHNVRLSWAGDKTDYEVLMDLCASVSKLLGVSWKTPAEFFAELGAMNAANIRANQFAQAEKILGDAA